MSGHDPLSTLLHLFWAINKTMDELAQKARGAPQAPILYPTAEAALQSMDEQPAPPSARLAKEADMIIHAVLSKKSRTEDEECISAMMIALKHDLTPRDADAAKVIDFILMDNDSWGYHAVNQITAFSRMLISSTQTHKSKTLENLYAGVHALTYVTHAECFSSFFKSTSLLPALDPPTVVSFLVDDQICAPQTLCHCTDPAITAEERAERSIVRLLDSTTNEKNEKGFLVRSILAEEETRPVFVGEKTLSVLPTRRVSKIGALPETLVAQ